MVEDRERIRRLERLVRLLVLGVVVSVVGAAGALLYSAPWGERGASDVGEFAGIVLEGGALLEVVDSELQITLPDDQSGVVLRAPDGSEIARLGGVATRQLAE